MRKVFMMIFILFATLTVIPYLIIINFSNKKDVRVIEPETVMVYIKEENRVEKMEINQYLKEVVSAEMPAQFHPEALKAQAVAARTYLINRIRAYEKGEKPAEHMGADICTDSAHCKAWISEEKRKKLWEKDKRQEYWKKISDAVDNTGSLIVTYNSEPISAVFHSTSSGYTENSEDVWTSQVAYLRSVKSEGDEKSPKFHSQKEMTIDEFKRIAEEKIEGVSWDDYIIGDIERSDAGGIKTIDVGGISVKGSDFRFMYDLRSANIQIEIIEEVVKMDVKGYGHGVGMSQYGADYLARQGKNFEDILKTYYTGVSLDECKKST